LTALISVREAFSQILKKLFGCRDGVFDGLLQVENIVYFGN